MVLVLMLMLAVVLVVLVGESGAYQDGEHNKRSRCNVGPHCARLFSSGSFSSVD